MAKTVLTNVRAFANGLDLTADTNKVTLSAEVEEQEVTSFGSGGAKEFLGGLRSFAVAGAGQWEAGDATQVDDALWAAAGGVGPLSVIPDGGATVGDVAYAGQVLAAKYAPIMGSVGEVAAWELDATGSGPLVRGVVAHPPATARTASGTGTALNLGAVGAAQALHCAVHVLSVSGTLGITVRVETDDASGFASPTTRVTGTAVATAGAPTGQWLATATGAITDTWQRVAWATTGTGSALFVAVIGII